MTFSFSPDQLYEKREDNETKEVENAEDVVKFQH